MTAQNPDHAKHSIANYEGLKTAIVNGETKRVESLLADQSMQPLEKSYLLDLARLNGNSSIIALLEAVPERE